MLEVSMPFYEQRLSGRKGCFQDASSLSTKSRQALPTTAISGWASQVSHLLLQACLVAQVVGIQAGDVLAASDLEPALRTDPLPYILRVPDDAQTRSWIACRISGVASVEASSKMMNSKSVKVRFKTLSMAAGRKSSPL